MEFRYLYLGIVTIVPQFGLIFYENLLVILLFEIPVVEVLLQGHLAFEVLFGVIPYDLFLIILLHDSQISEEDCFSITSEMEFLAVDALEYELINLFVQLKPV